MASITSSSPREWSAASAPRRWRSKPALTPRQDNVTAANHYLGASGEFDAGGGWSLTVRGGYEDGFYDGKWDWEAGAGYTVGQITASLAYVDTNYSSATEAGRLGAAGLVASLAAEF